MNTNMTMRHRPLALLAVPLLLAACATTPTTSDSPGTEAGAAATTNAWSTADQMIVVTSKDWDAVRGTMRRFERNGASWRQVGGATPVMLGRTGIAWGSGLHPMPQTGGPPAKHEGDGKSPAGVFGIGIAFGYPERVDTPLDYRQMQATNWCMDVPGSPLYNRIVDSREVGEAAVKGSSEPMRLDRHNNGDDRYKLGFVIQHNPDNVDRGGSCIFAHLWGNPDKTTAGCTAMAESVMRDMLAWLKPAAHPVLVQLTDAEYDRKQRDWQLPARNQFK